MREQKKVKFAPLEACSTQSDSKWWLRDKFQLAVNHQLESASGISASSLNKAMTVTYHEKFPYLHYSEDLLIASCACAVPHQPQKQSAAQIAPKLDETSSFLLGVVASSMLTNAYRVCFVVRFVGGSLASFHFNNTEPIIKHHLVIHELKYCQRGGAHHLNSRSRASSCDQL